MPRRREKTWGELKIGITVVAVASLALLLVFVAGSERGPFLPATYALYLDLDDAGGIRVGSPVRVAGLAAGEVADLEIVPPGEAPPFAADTLVPLTGDEPDLRDIRLELSVQKRFGRYITPSSRAQLASLGMGGERYVQISAGDVRETPLEPGSEVPAAASLDLDLVLARLARAFNETQEIAEISEEIRAKLASGSGTLPRLMDERAALRTRAGRLGAESRSLLALVDSGPGVVPRARHDPALARLVDSLSANVAALEAALDDGSAKRWLEREELDEALTDFDAEVADLAARLDGGEGSLGRFLRDEELFLQIRVLQRRLGELVAAFKADPLGFVDIDLF